MNVSSFPGIVYPRVRQALLAVALSAACTLALGAIQRQPGRDDAGPASQGIASVTDANGHPLPLREAAASTPNAASARKPAPTMQRGQAWWPYASSLPPYNAVNERAEAMGDDEIQVNGVALISIRDPEATLRLIPADLRLAAGSQLARKDGYYLVKIAGYSRTQEQIDALTRAGATLGEYMNINTYFAKIPSASLAMVKALPFVTYVGDYHPAYKISPRIGLTPVPVSEALDAVTGREKPWLFEVTLQTGADVNNALNHLAKYGVYPDRTDVVASDALTAIVVAAAPEAVLSMAQVPEVKWIAEKSFPQLLASSTSPSTIPMILQNNGVFTTNTALGWKLWGVGIDGTGTGSGGVAPTQIVTLMDTGLDTNVEHMAQSSTAVGTIGPSHRKVVGYDVYGGDQCVLSVSGVDEGHGTWTSQHAVGSISNMTANPDTTHTPTTNYDNGIARGAKVYFQDIGTSAGTINPPFDLGPSIAQAISKGSFIQNDSWGTGSSTYDTTASNLDNALFNNPNFVVTVAAGNTGASGQGTIGSPASAKNCIAVGGNDIASPDNLFINCSWDGTPSCASTDLGSSRGPVFQSNRVKPDIMTYVYASSPVGGEQQAIDEPAAMCQTDATKNVHWSYVNTHGFGGTSFAAPEVAGLAALVRDYFMQGFYPTGAATAANTLTPSGSLVKAVILASGEPMATTSSPSAQTIQTRYSNDVGYGRANLPSVLHIGSFQSFLWVQNNAALGQAATSSTYYNINGNAVPLRVMLVWYDAAGNTIQKDADLRVTIGGNVYLGNVMSGSWSTTGGTPDHTNTTEGVFLDAAHGLPASGQVQVDVIGFNDPGGMSYSLVVSGNVASASVTTVALDKGLYTCAGTINVTVNDAGTISPVSATLTSRDSASNVIDTEVVTCTGSNGTFTGSVVEGSGLTVANGGTVTATYGVAAPANATIVCQAPLGNGGFSIGGGCDNAAAGTDIATGPLTNGGSNEYYTKYMDANEYSSYKFAFVNNTGAALTDATVALSFSGSGASKMTAFNGPIHVGTVAAGATAGAVFQLYTSPTTAGLTPVNLDFDVTSPADGYTTPTRITQAQLLQANDRIARQQRCSTFNTQAQFNTWTESVVNGHPTNPWRWSGSATTPSTVGSETRTDGLCANSTANAAAMLGNSGIGSGSNFTANADSVLLQNFQPALTGNGPNGQPYHYNWAWHSFYHSSETVGAATGVWGIFYNDQWNSSIAPTGTQLSGFGIKAAYYYQSLIFDTTGSWNWDPSNTGTPDNPSLGPATGGAPNQVIFTFAGVTGLATPSTWFAYGQEHADLTVFGGMSSDTTRRDIAFDNDNLVYDEYYTEAQAAACNGGTQIGQVSFDQIAYGTCPTNSARISVLDANGVSGMTVTVTSPGTGDSEVVTLTGSAPYFSGTLALSTVSGLAANNGTLFVLPQDTISATYTDASPAGSTTAAAAIACAGADVVYVTNAQVSDNGDNDGIPDNNECVTMDITIKNNLGTSLTNTRVQIFSASPTIDVIPDDHAMYGTVAPGATATNPASDRFTFHVASSVACTDPANPPTATFQLVITADGVNGATASQKFTLSLDRNQSAGTTSYTQSFTANPGWTVGVTPPDNPGCGGNVYSNDFHWCAACGNGGGGYGAWVGSQAFGTVNQNYTAGYNSSTLYSPIFTAGGTAVTLQFREAARTETPFDGAIVQYQLGAGAWTTLAFTTPAQAATTTGNFCSPILAGTSAWTGNATGTTWTLTNAASVTTTSGQPIQFRWRLGGDISGNGTSYGGYGVDDVTVTGLQQVVCEPNRNGGLAACCLAPTGLTNNTAVDTNLCAAAGIQLGWAKDPDNWGDGGAGTRTYDVLRNGVPIVSGIAYGTTSYTDATASPGVSYTYSIRYDNGCGASATTAGMSRADSSTVTCSALDSCHVAGTCDPSTGVCSNPNAPNGTSCTDGDACTQSDSCQNGNCVGTNPVVCTALDQCHVAGICKPLTGNCTNPGAPNGTTCNDGNACTQTDTCQSGTCAGSNPIVCAASDQCHAAGTCDPANGACSNPTAPNGTSCGDGNNCTTGDTCQSGACTSGTPVVCTASDACHVAGTCNPASGTCSNPTAPDGTSCNDGNACTQTDSCQSGTCTGSNPIVCTASDQCHVAGACNPAIGACSNPPASNGTGCNDGNACTQTDTCQGGTCTGGNPVVCTASDQCHVAGTCSPGTGTCSNPIAANGTGCNDGNPCTRTDTCQNGACTGANPVVCTASDQCHRAGTCVPSTGTCTNPIAANGTSCNDGNSCTQSDTCQGGTCFGANPVVCTASDQCHAAGTCNPADGTCSNPAAPNGTSCNDNNACTQSDSCQGGTCTGASPVVCAASDQCHVAGTCDPSSGACSNPAAPNGTGCSDGNACTQSDSCQNGTCTAGPPVVCTALDACHVAGTCNPGTGTCSTPSAPNGTSCNDGSACTQVDSCQNGACVGSNPVVCQALDQCHVAGICNAANGACSNPRAPNGTSCNDGNACTQTDVCQAGSCVGANPVVCAASDQCHVAGTCDTQTGSCSNPAAPNGTGCDDANACTQTDTCQAGACTGANPVICTPSDACHLAGVCDPSDGSCSDPMAPDGTTCSDDNACTQTDSCEKGECIGSNPVVCTASDQCHVAGVCDTHSGSCSNPAAPNGTECDDSNFCTLVDHCQSGACTGTPAICTASDQCHVAGACDPQLGTCSNPAAPNGTSCNDGNPCTVGEACGGGVCTGGTTITAPAETHNVLAAANKNTYSWSAAASATQYDVVRGRLSGLPVGPGGADEVCFDNLGNTTVIDTALPTNGTGFWYLSRGENACGNGTFGTQSNGTPRTTTTCP